MKRILFSSDIHGNLYQYEELVEQASKEKASTIIIGGDLTFKNKKVYFNRPPPSEFTMTKSPEVRRVFFKTYVFPILKKFLEKKVENLIILCYGNADYSENLEYYRGLHPQMIVLTEDVFSLTPKFDLLVYSPVNLSPHRLKDNERFEFMEHEKYENKEYTTGYVSWKEEKVKEYGFAIQKEKVKELGNYGSIIQIEFRKNPKFSIEYELGNLIKNKTDPKKKKTIWITHAPPYEINDTILGREGSFIHVGSKCIRKFVEEYQPAILLTGHIHESYFLTDKYVETVGKTNCVCSANSPSSVVLHSVLLEIEGEELTYRLIEVKYQDKLT